MQKRTEITIETERVLIVSPSPEKTIKWCNSCEKNVTMLTIFEAATIAGTSPQLISRLAETGRLHLAVTPEGRLFVCPHSLSEVETALRGPDNTQRFTQNKEFAE
jgi:hypothetical protein